MQYGYFDDEKREYVITRPDTPRPWSNYIGSADFGAVITNNAAGYTFYKSAAQGRLTRFRFNSIMADMPGKYVYIRDNENADFWTNSWQPVAKDRDAFDYNCRFGTGYCVISSEYAGIASECTYFVPAGNAYEVWNVEIENRSESSRRLSAFPFIEAQCNWNAIDDSFNLQYNQYIVKTEIVDGIIDIGSNVNMPEDPENFTNKDQKRHRFFGLCGVEAASFDSDLEKFIGNYGSYARPKAVTNGKCTGSLAAGDNPCGAFQVDLDLQPGEKKLFTVVFGAGQAGDAGKAALKSVNSQEKVRSELEKVRDYWHSRLKQLSAKTPDSYFNSMVNTWAPYNNLMTFYWSRTASMVYAGERDGLGFRDSVQDIVGASSIVNEEAGGRLELLLTGQVSTGGAMPVVKPFDHHPGKESADQNYRADDCMWFFNAVPEYVRETGDFDFYKKILPYADKGEDTVFGHLRRAIEFNLERSGAHDLPCGLHADWNDCIRLGEKGESVFVAFQLRLALAEYAEIARRLGETGEVRWSEERLSELDSSLEKYAWDGEWYLRAYRFDGLKFGSAESDEGRIFMNPQTWSVISGHAKDQKAATVMEAMHRELATEYGIMICTPPYVQTDPEVCLGRLMNPGMKENGGIFNHTQGWAVMAAAKLAMGDRAWEYMRAVMPAGFNDKAETREVEPYAVCQSTHSRFSPRFGSGRISWLSGSAVWNYYAMTNAILGIKPHYDGLEINPCIPSSWPGFRAKRIFRGCRFDITVRRGNSEAFTVNKKSVDGRLVKAETFLEKNTVELTLA